LREEKAVEANDEQNRQCPQTIQSRKTGGFIPHEHLTQSGVKPAMRGQIRNHLK
jgi:hypothetical protein